MSNRTYSNRREVHKPNFLMKLFDAFKSMLLGAINLLGFVFAPIWNHPERMKVLTRWMWVLFASLFTLWLMFWLGQRPVFSIKQIQIESNNGEPLKHVNLPAVRSLVIGNLTGNFFSIRLDNARAAFESVPWVRKASVRRVWPNGLAVTIEEHKALGIWGGAQEPTLMNTYGELFVANVAEAEADGKLVTFNGPPESSRDVLALYEQLNKWFAPWNAKATEVSLSNRYAWSSKLDNGMRFEFGRDLDQRDREQINARMDRFFKAWPQVQEKWPGKIDMVDLRYPNGFAIRLNAPKSVEGKGAEIKLAAHSEDATKTTQKKAAHAAEKAKADGQSKKLDKKNIKLVDKNGRSN